MTFARPTFRHPDLPPNAATVFGIAGVLVTGGPSGEIRPLAGVSARIGSVADAVAVPVEVAAPIGGQCLQLGGIQHLAPVVTARRLPMKRQALVVVHA